jgi:hypothetical protein
VQAHAQSTKLQASDFIIASSLSHAPTSIAPSPQNIKLHHTDWHKPIHNHYHPQCLNSVWAARSTASTGQAPMPCPR